MANPIEAIPALYDEDTEEVNKQLEVVAFEEEITKRRDVGKKWLAKITKSKKK